MDRVNDEGKFHGSNSNMDNWSWKANKTLAPGYDFVPKGLCQKGIQFPLAV